MSQKKSSCSYIVYAHVFPNKKKYFGITSQVCYKRWKYGSGYKGQKYIFRAINKYGWNNIDHFILFEGVSEKEAKKKEIELIAKYQSNEREFGYNISSGGEGTSGFTLPISARKKISKRLKGKYVGSLNAGSKKVYTYDMSGNFLEEYENARRASEQTGAHWKRISSICNNKKGFLSAANRIFSFEKKPHIEVPKDAGGRQAKKKRVGMYDAEGNLIEVFESVYAASKRIGKPIKRISRVLHGGRKRTGGYYWRLM